MEAMRKPRGFHAENNEEQWGRVGWLVIRGRALGCGHVAPEQWAPLSSPPSNCHSRDTSWRKGNTIAGIGLTGCGWLAG